jgi:aminopeptidase N
MKARFFQQKRTPLLLLILPFLFQGCVLFQDSADGKAQKSGSSKERAEKEQKDSTGTARSGKEAEKEEEKVEERPVYRASETRVHDLVHTVLDVRFDLKKRYLYGKAEIDLTPHFYPTDSLHLDAKGFDLDKVALVTDTGRKPLSYRYDERRIHIDLDSSYGRRDTFRVFIDYTAKPAELDLQGSQAISSAQGLYFIDPMDEDPDKPTQIWTQGETESSSCWFPTIDAPNQKMSQEISITVRDSFKTLSNGSLQYSIQNGDGTRTDHWKQEKPHAPYLTMMAIGDFAVVEDEWKDMPVNYWVEKDYRESAMDIFGNTPEMIEFYSDTLGFEYPWAKYDQVVVRDFVSGAMENTTATVHGSMQRMTERELIDGDNEPTIAHELIHHWFGNVVTCESWANLPLNEAFATYGEYLWEEHKYGREAADKLLQDKLNTYFRQAQQKQVDLIRFDYGDKESMFDAFSYHKGSRVLHMLRKYVGNDAFFQALELYLHDNAYEPVEIHDMRLAFEEVTGEDLNWFFEQWFLDKGHPVLDISYRYLPEKERQEVIVRQEQDTDEWPLYKLPFSIDIYQGAEKERHEVILNASVDTFSFRVEKKPDLVNVDAEKMLLCKKQDHKSRSAYIHQYEHAPLYLDRYEAVEYCQDRRDSISAGVVLRAMEDDHPRIRRLAYQDLGTVFRYYPEKAEQKLLEHARSDEHAPTRATALSMVREYLEGDRMELYESALKDSSYMNVSTALRAISEENPKRGAELAKELEDSENEDIVLAVATIYASEGTPGKNAFFLEHLEALGIRSKMGYLQTYSDYLQKQDFEAVEKALPALENEAIEGGHWYVQFTAVRSIKALMAPYEEERKGLEKDLEELKEKADDEEKELSEAEKEERREKQEALQRTEEQLGTFRSVLDRIREKVENQRILRYLGN